MIAEAPAYGDNLGTEVKSAFGASKVALQWRFGVGGGIPLSFEVHPMGLSGRVHSEEEGNVEDAIPPVAKQTLGPGPGRFLSES